jgi:hypothetical protein
MGISGYNLSDFTAGNMLSSSPFVFTALDGAQYETTVQADPTDHGMDVTITIKNIRSDTTTLPWPVFWIPTGWDSVSGTKLLTRYWMAKSKFQPFMDIAPFSGGVIENYYGLGVPQGAFCHCMSFDNSGSGDTEQTFGVATDYPYASDVLCTFWTSYRLIFAPSYQTINVKRVVPNYIRPGETKTIKFWLRWADGVGEYTAVSVLEPYIEHVQDNYPLNYPPKFRGRVAGTAVADESQPAGADGKYYRSYLGKRVTEFSGWAEFLDAVAQHNFTSVESLRNNHYRAFQLWAISGFVNSYQDFVPDVFTSLPPNLKNTMNELVQWQIDNDFKVIIWCGRAFSSYRPEGASWSSALLDPLSGGYYTYDGSIGELFDPVTWQTWTIKPEADLTFRQNIFEMAKYAYGLGFDAEPEYAYDPWIDTYLTEIRDTYPSLYISGEASKTDRGRHISPNYYYPESDTVGAFQGRCPLMNRIFPSYVANVQKTNIFGDGATRIAFIENEGMTPIIVGTMLDTDWSGPLASSALTATINAYASVLSLRFTAPFSSSWINPLIDTDALNSLRIIVPNDTLPDRTFTVSGGSLQIETNGDVTVSLTINDPTIYHGEDFYITCDEGLLFEYLGEVRKFTDNVILGSFIVDNQSTISLAPAPANVSATIGVDQASISLTWTN